MNRAGAPATVAAKGDAIAILKADHEAVTHLFADYGKTYSMPDKRALVAEICSVLSVHAQISEEIFYPAVKDALKDLEGGVEARVGNAEARELIAQLEGLAPDGRPDDAKVRALSDHVKHHVKAEQGEIFPRARATTLDLQELGARMAARRHDLLARQSALRKRPG